jgi:hypothetical protein
MSATIQTPLVPTPSPVQKVLGHSPVYNEWDVALATYYRLALRLKKE